MNFKTSLTKIISPELVEHGFYYEGKAHPLGWRFVKELEHIKQFITFSKSPLDSRDVRFELSTSLRPQDIIYSSSLLEENRYENAGYWHFNDESSLEDTIRMMLDVLTKKGFNTLDLLSIPDLLPTKEQEEYFFATYKEKAMQFSDKWNKDYNNFILKEIEEILIEHGQSGVPANWNLLMMIAAYLGELLVNQLGGEWAWDELRSMPVVRKIGGKPVLLLNPLRVVSKFLGNPRRAEYGLQTIYNQFNRIASM